MAMEVPQKKVLIRRWNKFPIAPICTKCMKACLVKSTLKVGTLRIQKRYCPICRLRKTTEYEVH